ncbi:MAG: hypothetical protein K2X99_08625 [Gemmatimonadaceae bacterium]|nr:hypothetical protein [Gemmatimonadaceae bacterium]
MQMIRFARGLGLVAALAVTGCKSLDIQNPNAPDAKRALSDPAAIEAVGAGALRTWFNTYELMWTGGTLSPMAQTFTASWNNFNMNFYSSIDADGTRNSRAWQNDPAQAGRTNIERGWEGYYSAISSATDALRAVRVNKVVVNTAADTKRLETISVLALGMALGEVALNYDKGYIVDETVDLGALQYSNRKQLRDAAVAKLTEAAALATANSFTTPTGWTNGFSYTNTQIAQLANTYAAKVLAYYPRSAAENAQVNWAQVLTFASRGISSTTSFDLVFQGDGCVAWCHEILTWFDAMDTGRVHTRVASMLDPVTQRTPWPDPTGNGKPNSADKRLGDGSFGDASIVTGFGTYPKTANAGTDFAWSSQANFRPSRGQYHQSNIGHIRYDLTGKQDLNGIYSGFGPAPAILAAENNLLWAEALIRTGGSLDLAAQLINRTRVTRGGLPAATAADGAAGLTARLSYEQEIELLGLGSVPYYNRRRVDGLVTGTPREMPVPAKELGVKGEAFYTWGGATPSSPTPP